MKVTLTVEVEVTDLDALRAYAERRYAASWFAELPTSSPGTLVAEALVLSNENPSPADYGIEITDWNAEVMA